MIVSKEGVPLGRLLWHDHTFALVKHYVYDKPRVEYIKDLEIFLGHVSNEESNLSSLSN